MSIPKIVIVFVVSLSLLSPSLSTARYIIKLKNGREIITERYWNEGNKVMFERDSGVLGVSKDQIVEIKEEETKTPGVEVQYSGPRDATPSTPPPDAHVATTTPPAPPTPPANTGQEQAPAATPQAGKKKEKIDEEYYKQKRQELMDRINTFVEQRSQATQNRDETGKQTARQGYLKAADELYALQEELKEKNGGELPEWWNQL